MKRILAVLLLAAPLAAQVSPPNNSSRVAGRFVAYNYGGWSLPLYQFPSGTGAKTFTLSNSTVNLGDGRLIMPFNTNAQIYVGTELVTVSAVGAGCLINSTIIGGCSITATFSKTHQNGEPVTSGTFGLQEALNDAGASGGGAVTIDSAWAKLGGTTGIVSGATLPSNTAIEDVRTGAGSSYTLPIATTSVLGGIKPDGTTITVNGSTGVASASGSGSSVWSSLTAPAADLALIMSTYKTSFTNTNPFTAQASFYSPWQFAGGGINFGNEWNALYSAYMPNAYPSDEFDVGIAVPNTSAAFQSQAIGAFANCAQPSGNHYCLALYAQAEASALASAAYGFNANVFDGTSGTNYAGNLYGGEFNAQVFNPGTTGELLRLSANIVSGATFNGLHIAFASGVLANGILIDNNTATNAMSIGYQTATGIGIPITFHNVNGTATLGYNLVNQFAATGNGYLAPGYSTATNCVSSASPAVCGAAPAGLVAVPAGGTTLVVGTTAVNTGSEVQLTFDSSLGAELGVTCNTAINQPTKSALTPGTNFTITMSGSISVNPDCVSYVITNPFATAVTYQMSDAFTGSGALTSHTADTGQTWASANGSSWTQTATLNGSNKVTVTSVSLDYASLTPSTANYTVSAGCTLGASGGGWCDMFARLNGLSSSNFNGYGCRFIQGTGMELEKWVTASNTQIGTTDTTATGGTHTIAIKANSTTLTCYIDGVASVTATGTDSTYSAAGAAGLALANGSGSGYTINSPFTVQ